MKLFYIHGWILLFKLIEEEASKITPVQANCSCVNNNDFSFQWTTEILQNERLSQLIVRVKDGEEFQSISRSFPHIKVTEAGLQRFNRKLFLEYNKPNLTINIRNASTSDSCQIEIHGLFKNDKQRKRWHINSYLEVSIMKDTITNAGVTTSCETERPAISPTVVGEVTETNAMHPHTTQQPTTTFPITKPLGLAERNPRKSKEKPLVALVVFGILLVVVIMFILIKVYVGRRNPSLRRPSNYMDLEPGYSHSTSDTDNLVDNSPYGFRSLNEESAHHYEEINDIKKDYINQHDYINNIMSNPPRTQHTYENTDSGYEIPPSAVLNTISQNRKEHLNQPIGVNNNNMINSPPQHSYENRDSFNI